MYIYIYIKILSRDSIMYTVYEVTTIPRVHPTNTYQQVNNLNTLEKKRNIQKAPITHPRTLSYLVSSRVAVVEVDSPPAPPLHLARRWPRTA